MPQNYREVLLQDQLAQFSPKDFDLNEFQSPYTRLLKSTVNHLHDNFSIWKKKEKINGEKTRTSTQTSQLFLVQLCNFPSVC